MFDYRKVWLKVPYNIRVKLRIGRLKTKHNGENRRQCDEVIRRYMATDDAELKECLSYIRKKNEVSFFNEPWVDKYKILPVDIERDNDNWPYCIYKEKRLYLKKSWDDERCRNYVKSLICEQADESPHRYITENFDVKVGDVVYDVGAAEGNFMLEVIDRVSKGVMIEYDLEWIEALKKTFVKYMDKLTIYSGLVGIEGVTLDQVATNTGLYPNLIKMDIEGEEVNAIDGIIEIENKIEDFRMFVCTYHKEKDESVLKSKLKDKYEIETSRGWVYFRGGFRRGLIRVRMRRTA